MAVDSETVVNAGAAFGSGALAVCALFVALLLHWLIKRILLHGRRKSKLPPGPRPLPIIGNMHQMGGDNPHQELWHLAQKYGPIMFLRLGAVPLVVVSSAEAADEFLKVQDKAWAGRPPSISGQIFNNNYKNVIGAPYGPYLRHLRKICILELLTTKRLDTFRPSRTEEFNHMVRSIYDDSAQGKPVKLIVNLGHLATNNITRMLLNKRFFGVDTAGQIEARKFKKMIEKTLFTISTTRVVGDFVPWLKWVTHATGYVAYMKKVKAEVDAFLQEFLDIKKSGMKLAAAAEESDRQEDFVDVLLSQSSENGTGKLDDESILGILQDMLLAGTDTSSNTVEWAITELLRHPECMQKLQGELDAVVGKERVVAEADIPNMRYLRAVVKEILRLYPPAPLSLPHESTQPTTVWGYDLPAGTRMLTNMYAIQRDPKHWPHPLQFDPERFIDNPAIDVKGYYFQLIPFGTGRRQCPGMALGMLFVTIGVARLVQGFDFALPDGQSVDTLDVVEKFGMTLPRANPLEVKATPRLAAHLY